MRSSRIRIRIRCSHLSLAAKNLLLLLLIIIASRFDSCVFFVNTATAKALSCSALSRRLCLVAKKRDSAQRMRRRSREATHRNSLKSVAIFPHNNCLYKEEVKEEEREWHSTNEKRKTRRIERKSTTTFPT
jgi:hypothetical protein